MTELSQRPHSEPTPKKTISSEGNTQSTGSAKDQDTHFIDGQLSSYDYELPEEFIAQSPVSPRDRSRLLIVQSQELARQRLLNAQDPTATESQYPVTAPTFTTEHRQFFNLPDYLEPGDLLVLNNTRVIPARLYGYKRPPSHVPPTPNPSLVEVFLLEKRHDNQWLALVRPGKRLRPGATIQFGPTASGCLVYGHIQTIDQETGGRIIDFEIYEMPGPEIADPKPSKDEQANAGDNSETPAIAKPWELLSLAVEVLTRSPRSLWDILPELGDVPLPPYISNDDVDPERYQTVYSDRPGAVAAPTAGLHFTPSLLQQLDDMGVKQAFITLHVGVGTFRPVEVEDIKTHHMHEEWIEVPAETVAQIRETKANGGRVIAVGTTATRALEGAAQDGTLKPFQGKTNIFIYPGYQWRVIDGLITNFHLPKSSLMMMVSALISREALLAVYAEAIAQHYRFYSFGDAMLLLPTSSEISNA